MRLSMGRGAGQAAGTLNGRLLGAAGRGRSCVELRPLRRARCLLCLLAALALQRGKRGSGKRCRAHEQLNTFAPSIVTEPGDPEACAGAAAGMTWRALRPRAAGSPAEAPRPPCSGQPVCSIPQALSRDPSPRGRQAAAHTPTWMMTGARGLPHLLAHQLPPALAPGTAARGRGRGAAVARPRRHAWQQWRAAAARPARCAATLTWRSCRPCPRHSHPPMASVTRPGRMKMRYPRVLGAAGSTCFSE